jgi:hypothetical protein
MRIVYHPKVYTDLSAIMQYYEEVATAALADEFYREFKFAVKEAARGGQSLSGFEHATYGAATFRDFRSTSFFGLSMIPFAFWSFATTRDILPSEFGAAETRWDRGGGSLGTHRGRRSKNFFVEGEQRYWVHVAN